MLVHRQKCCFPMEKCIVMAVNGTLYMAIYNLGPGKTQAFLINAVSMPFKVSQARGKKLKKKNFIFKNVCSTCKFPYTGYLMISHLLSWFFKKMDFYFII